MIDTKQKLSDRSKPFDNELFRQQALTANLWVILATIVVSAACSLPFAGPERRELAIGFAVYFIANSLALGLSYRGAYRLALIGYTALGYISTGFAMVIMNAQPAHMVLAMANFVLLHAVVLGRRWALVLTAVMVSLIGLSVWGGEHFAPYFSELAAQGQMTRELSKYTTLMSLMTTAISTGYLIVTTVSYQERSRSAVLAVNRELELAKAALQVRHDRAKLLSELGAAAAAATDLTELRTLAEQTILQGLGPEMVELSLTGDPPVNGLAIGTGVGAVLVSPKQVLPDDDMRFLRTLVGLLGGAYTRIVAERTMFEAKRFEGVGRLAAGVAHDFNNLLMPICGSFDLVTAQHGSDEKLLKLIGPGYEAGLQARTLVQKLLVHAKSTEVKLEQVDLAALVRGNELLLRSFVPDGVELVLHFDASVVRVRADRVELQQVLLNLTLNALAAVGTSGRVKIIVQEHNGFGKVVVIDDGPGIDPALQSWIFEPFNSTNPSGTGLGLATVARIAESGGGTVATSNLPEGGARFVFELPLMDGFDTQQDAPVESTIVIAPMHVLVVEDDERVRDILTEMLNTLGHTAVTVSDAPSGLAALKEGHEFDLVMSDFQMPGMTGADLLVAMRAAGNSTPLVLLSGYGSVVTDDFPIKPDATLAKPVSLSDLRSVLNELTQIDSNRLV